MQPSPTPFIRSRIGVVSAVTVGFVVGAAGFAAARDADPATTPEPVEMESSPSTDDDTTTTVDDGPGVTIDLTVPEMDDSGSSSDDDSPSTTVDDNGTDDNGTDDTLPDDSDDGVTDDTLPSSDDDSPSTTTPDDQPTTTVPGSDDDGVTDDTLPSSDDDSPSTTTPDDQPTTTVPDSTVPAVQLPAAFTETYVSSGGSINVSWTGTAFVLNAIDPADGFGVEIEDQRWDRIRVDFEGDDADARIDVRLSDDDWTIRVRID